MRGLGFQHVGQFGCLRVWYGLVALMWTASMFGGEAGRLNFEHVDRSIVLGKWEDRTLREEEEGTAPAPPLKVSRAPPPCKALQKVRPAQPATRAQMNKHAEDEPVAVRPRALIHRSLNWISILLWGLEEVHSDGRL